jgi:hypothetical protein
MDYLIPATSQEILALRQKPVDTETVASAIAGVIRLAQAQGRSLEDLKAELLEEDPLLDAQERTWLSEVVASTWNGLA